jgi:hypothetical protein
MPSPESVKRVKSAAKFLQYPDAIANAQFLHPTLQTAIAILQAIPKEGATYAEIAQSAGVAENTVKQFTLALRDGGYPIAFGLDTVSSSLGGRPNNRIFKKWLKISKSDFIGVEGIGEKGANRIAQMLSKHYGIDIDQST